MPKLSAIAAGLALAFTLAATFDLPPSRAQTVAAKEIEGTWQLLSATATEGEKKRELFGANPKGQLVLGSDGRFTMVVARADLPKYKSGSRARGTADEYQATVQGSVAYFGTYKVEGNELVFKVEGSTFPNWVGETQRRPLKLSGDELSYTSPAPIGGAPTALVWKRLK